MRVRMELEYDGTSFAGWQRQRGARTVQGIMEEALGTFYRRPITVVGAGRTDAGVHATGQVAHADLPEHAEGLVRLHRALNGLTPGTVAVRRLEAAPAGFHARHSAIWRHYRYRMTQEPVAYERQYIWFSRTGLSVPLLRRAGEALPGEHDFASFCVAKSAPSGTRCHVLEATWKRSGRELRFDIRGNRFVHGMVRLLVGAMVEVASGRLSLPDFEMLLSSPRCRNARFAAPAHGLCLVAVGYEHDRTGTRRRIDR